MSFISLASEQSRSRGYDYYINKHVLKFEEVEPGVYSGLVQGSGNAVYNVTIDVDHVQRSKCDCPFANDKMVVCKHAVALYFAVFPKEAENFKEECQRKEEENKRYMEDLDTRLEKSIDSMSKQRLKDVFLNLLNDCPGWLRDKYIYKIVEGEWF